MYYEAQLGIVSENIRNVELSKELNKELLNIRNFEKVEEKLQDMPVLEKMRVRISEYTN